MPHTIECSHEGCNRIYEFGSGQGPVPPMIPWYCNEHMPDLSLDPEYINERYIETQCMLRCPQCGSTSMTLESNLGCREPYDDVTCHECNIKWDRKAFIRDYSNCILTYEESKKASAKLCDHKIQQALFNLREMLAETRGKYGRDFIRKLPQGKLLDALDANRECGFPEDCL